MRLLAIAAYMAVSLLVQPFIAIVLRCPASPVDGVAMHLADAMCRWADRLGLTEGATT